MSKPQIEPDLEGSFAGEERNSSSKLSQPLCDLFGAVKKRSPEFPISIFLGSEDRCGYWCCLWFGCGCQIETIYSLCLHKIVAELLFSRAVRFNAV